MNKLLERPSEVVTYILDSGLYHAYLLPSDETRRMRRMCFCVDDLHLDCFLEGDTKRAIMLSLDGYTFLSSLLSDEVGGACSVYDSNPAMRRRALAFWRRLVKKLREDGK